MENTKLVSYIKNVVENMPKDWLNKTTHRLDIYNEELAKTQFLEQFEALFKESNSAPSLLESLPTAYDYIRLGHPLSCLLEWFIGNLNNLKPQNIISFSSKTMPVLAILRKNLLDKKNTQIAYKDKLPDYFNEKVLKEIYGYRFELLKVKSATELSKFDGSVLFLSKENEVEANISNENIDFYINFYKHAGSVVLANSESSEGYIKEIQHVRRRETIAMTPQNCFFVLNKLVGKSVSDEENSKGKDKAFVQKSINEITHANTDALLGSCGLSIQYSILMGLVHTAKEKYPNKKIKIIVPPNCYGGTNDQARRLAACIESAEVVDLPVDGGNDMVGSVDQVLNTIAEEDAIPYIIAEIPTNPRVEVPDLEKLNEVLTKKRKTKNDDPAIEPVFILDQTFCPNVNFLSETAILSSVKTISYVSGSKFPSGGLCTAGYCVANKKSEYLMKNIETHLKLCDNEATAFQTSILAEKISSMNARIKGAYKNTREFVNHIRETLPEAKINFVSEDLAEKGFTPSVFSLDLPTKGNNAEEKEAYKRELNYKLINLMINKIPDESQHCVSYGQLKGSYWTIPATSTQGTTKEGDKDYIVRVSMSPDMDIELHKKVFLGFAKGI